MHHTFSLGAKLCQEAFLLGPVRRCRKHADVRRNLHYLTKEFNQNLRRCFILEHKDLYKTLKRKSKKKIKIITLMLFTLILIAIIYSLVSHRQYDLIETISPDGSHKIIVKYMDTHAWPFGPHDILILYRNKDSLFTHRIFKTKLYNDGKNPDKHNCTIRWENSVAVITLIGEEQQNEIYKIDFITMEVEALK